MSEENMNPDLPEENPTPEAEDCALEPAPFSLDRIPEDSPLAGLVERAKIDPGLPFEAAILDALAELRREDPPAFEVLRTELKREAKIRVTALDRALPRDESEERHSQAQVLSDMAAGAALFHDADGNGFADLTIAGHRETWPIRSKGFRRWLARQFYEETGGAPTGEAMQAALNVAEARAIYDCPEYPVFNRVGGDGERLFLDLGDGAWRAVEITREGWQVVEEPPVRFRRAAGVRELPEPETGGSIEDLRPFLNVGGHADFVLAVAWLLAALRPSGPYPVLALAGEQGSAKSTFTANLRALVDPNAAPLRALPREDRDLFIAAQNGHVLAFDNVSGLPAWIRHPPRTCWKGYGRTRPRRWQSCAKVR